MLAGISNFAQESPHSLDLIKEKYPPDLAKRQMLTLWYINSFTFIFITVKHMRAEKLITDEHVNELLNLFYLFNLKRIINSTHNKPWIRGTGKCIQVVFLIEERICVLLYFQHILKDTELTFRVMWKQYDYLDFLELVGLSFHGI